MVLFLNLSDNLIFTRAGKEIKETKELNDNNESTMS